MSEQQGETTTTTATDTPPSDAWGQPIRPERQAKLQGYLDRWQEETDHGERKGPFDREPGAVYGVRLSGADVSWLAELSGRDEYRRLPNLHLEHADLRAAHLETLYCQPLG
jgi:hypothetical protein